MQVSQQKIKQFQKTIWDHYRKNKREMPWRETTDPYRILVSEIMLQQTQVSRVISKYEAFLSRFPDFASLATAPVSDVLRLWQGLGYNRRALNLQKAAQEVVKKYNGILPHDVDELEELSGIGEATAGAILAYAFNKPVVYVETNIRRVFLYFFFPRSEKVPDEKLLPFIEVSVDPKKPREWYYALMDFGAMLKATVANPNKRSKHYSVQSKFEGSNRQIRGKILKILVEQKKIISTKLLTDLKDERSEKILSDLVAEGFLKREGKFVILS